MSNTRLRSRMFRSIRSRLIGSYILVLLMFLIVAGTFFSFAIQQLLQTEFRRNLENEARIMETVYRDNASLAVSTKESGDDMRKRLVAWYVRIRDLKRYSFQAEFAFILEGTDNQVYSFTLKGAQKGLPEDGPVTRERIRPYLLNTPQYVSMNYQGTSYEFSIRPLVSSSEMHNAWLVAYMPQDSMTDFKRQFVLWVALTLVLAVTIAFALGVFLSDIIARPLNLLRKRAAGLAARDFETKVHVQSWQEMEDFARDMNRIADELKSYDLSQRQLLQNVSHELRTPLMSIRGYAEALKEGVMQDTDKALGVIVDESYRLSALVDQLMYLTKLETGSGLYQMGDVPVNVLLRTTAERMQGLAINEKKTLRVSAGCGGVLTGDGDKLMQALINLIANGLRHARSWVSLSVRREDENNVVFSVIDDGEGIGEKELPILFGRFVKGDKGNLGLGLAICKAIIEHHQGTITAANGVQGGAIFTVTLPVRPEKQV